MIMKLVFIYFYVTISDGFADIYNDNAELLDKNILDFNGFLYDYISYMKWKRLCLIIMDVKFPSKDFQLHLSSQGIQSMVLEHFNNNSVVWRFKVNYDVKNLIVVGEVNNVVHATNQIVKLNMLKLKSYVLILCIDCKTVPKLCSAKDIFGSVLWAIPNNLQAPSSLYLHEMWYSYITKEFHTNEIGKWNLNDGITLGSQTINQRLDLQGTTLSLQAILPDMDDSHILGQGKNNTLEGFVIELINIMAEKLNFSYRISNIYNYSSIDLLSFLKNQKHDLTLFPATMTPSRVGLVDFTSSFLNEKIVIAMAKPTFHGEGSYMWLFKPFQISVWVTIAVTVAIISCAKMATKCHHPSDSTEGSWLIIIFYTVLQQGMPAFPTAHSSKIILVTGYLTFWLLFAFYTATLISSLTCNKPHEITLQGAKEYNSEVGLLDGSTKELLETTKDPLLMALSQRSFNVLHRKEYADSFCKREWAFIATKTAIKKVLLGNIKCEIQFSKEPVYRLNSHFAVKKDAVFTKRISKLLRKLHEYGIISRLRKKYFSSKQETEVKFIQIEIRHLYALLVILSIGVVASFSVMVIERFMCITTDLET